jgi:cytochrome c-type protein NapB
MEGVMTRFKPLNLSFFAVALALLLFGQPALAGEAGVVSLRHADVVSTDEAPDQKDYVGNRPGSQKAITRTFKQQPPLIPHMVTNFDEITLEENQCLTCHGPDVYKEKKSPKIGVNHFKNRAGKMLKQVSSARWACLQCHVPQVDAKPLVDNSFQAAAPPVPAK